MSVTFAALKDEYANLWSTMVVHPGIDEIAARTAARLLQDRARYIAVAKATGVPAVLIMALSERESGGRLSTYLGNGQPLNRVTTMVPRDRGPWATWEEGAIDGLTYQGFTKITGWTAEMMLWCAERYNGFGYRNNGHGPSPYLWAGTNHYTSGKYREEPGKPSWYDPALVDQQLGAAVVLRALMKAAPDLAIPAGQPLPAPPAVPPTPTPAQPHAQDATGAAAGGLLVAAGAYPSLGAIGVLAGFLVALAGFLLIKYLRSR